MRLLCLVDNCVLPQGKLWGEHGVSFLIEAGDDRVLFDTGTSGTVLMHNLDRLEIDPRTLDTVALSHAHRDHTGGLAALMGWVRKIPLVAHPGIFQERLRKTASGYQQAGIQLTADRLTEWFDLCLSADPLEIAPGVWTTGEIVQRDAPEGRSPHHFVPASTGYAPDPYQDDLSLVLQTPQGLVLLCGCCHAGLVNTLRHVERTFDAPLHGVVGGAHLMEADQGRLAQVIDLLTELSVPRLWLNHCTGQRALVELAKAFGEGAQSCPAGTRLEF